MKKLYALLLVLALAATMCFGAMAEAVNYVGVWTLTGLRSGEQVIDPAAIGMDMTIVINEDGTCTLSTTGETEQGVWEGTETGLVITDAAGTTQECISRDGALVITIEDLEMILTPAELSGETSDEAAYAQVCAGLTVADFAGNWTLEHVETTFGVYGADELGAGMTVAIEGENATIVMTTDAGDSTFTAQCVTEEAEGLGTILWASFIDPATGEPDGSGMMFLLYDDGQLVWYEYDSSQQCEYYYCFSKDAE